MGVVVFQQVNVRCMMYKAFAHLHTCTSRTVNLQHAAVGAFSELSASAVLGVTDARCCLTVTRSEQTASSFQHQLHGDNLAEPKQARFHCSWREAVDAIAVYIERSIGTFAAWAAAIVSTLKSQTAWLGVVRTSQKAALAARKGRLCTTVCFIPP